MLRFALILALSLAACDTPAEPDGLEVRAELAVDRAHQGFVDDETRAVVGLLEERAATGSTFEQITALEQAADLHLAVADTLLPHDRPPDDSDYAQLQQSTFERAAWRHREHAIRALERASDLGSEDPERAALLASLTEDRAEWIAAHQRVSTPALARLDRLEQHLDGCTDERVAEFRSALLRIREHIHEGQWDSVSNYDPILTALEQLDCG